MLTTWMESQGLSNSEFYDLMDSIMGSDDYKIVFNDEPAHAPAIRLTWLYDHAPIEAHKENAVYYYGISDRKLKLLMVANKNAMLVVRHKCHSIEVIVKDAAGKETLLCADITP